MKKEKKIEMYRNLELEDIVVDGEVEQWVQVCEVEELSEVKEFYWVSSFGRVKSTRGNGKILRQYNNRHGYLQVDLQTLDKPRKMRVNRLVAFAFVSGYSEERNQSNHINEVKTDNRAVNLNWMSAKQNANHGSRNKKIAEKQSKLVVGECVKTGNVIYFESTQEAQRNGFNSGHISSCCNGRRKTHKGFKWSYAESA